MEVLSKWDHPVPNVKEDLVAIDSRVDKVKALLELGTDDVRFIGIWGMGGIVRERSKKYSLENVQEIMISRIRRRKDVEANKYSKRRYYRKLRVSFDHGLKPVEQEIFLDIACFLKGEKVDYTKQVLDSFGFYTGTGIPILVEKSLIIIS
ncbi:hypothetical protein RJ640_006262 [Escallonia rubra]|uniref:Disease resistance protein Roq1-like winged-helix domain-containing protein n=1 Tax=Escallonia rubra TaxID=112253 RepID=A0AA88UME5_9ASTE|nr:hypothetical protein RJ640_006262 [Escallonia rubra]